LEAGASISPFNAEGEIVIFILLLFIIALVDSMTTTGKAAALFIVIS